ncbi:MAG TPA: hypothetical protein VFI63_01105 [Solirubrobacterales bacterium]|nr:hypothetical protein [Solirubrobacterales bacterium]
MKQARLMLSHPPVAPFAGSIEITNAILAEVLSDLGYETSSFYKLRPQARDIAEWVPLGAAGVVLRLQAGGDPDVEIRDNTSLDLFPPPRRGAHKNALVFHALFSRGEQWIGNEAIDGYWGNSAYMSRVVLSFLSLPSWRRGSLLDPRAFSLVGTVTLPLPLLAKPEVLIEGGTAELPDAALAALDGDDVLGHCVTHKIDERATYAILLALNQIALQSGIRRRFRLFVDGYLYDNLKRALADESGDRMPPEFRPLKAVLAQLGLSIDDILIPTPHLAQSALFKIVDACHFGLQYHWLPEPFGLFPLESVCHGCPVYTNGNGNLRHLLPAGHGIEVLESEAMAFGDLAAYAAVAQRIFHDTVVDPAPAREACRRGAELIAKTYTREALRRDLAARLAALSEPAEEHDLASARVVLGPMVRRFDPETRRVVSDYKNVELSPDQARLVQEAVGQTCGDLAHDRDGAEMELVDGLFQQGILAAFPPGGFSGEPVAEASGG